MSDPWKHPLPASVLLKAVAPGLSAPATGWHAATFSEHGSALLKAMVRLSRITTKTAKPYIERKANEIFNRQLARVISKVKQRSGHKAADDSILSDPIQISIGNDEALWAAALKDVFAETGDEIVIELVPPIQSVMGQAYGRVSTLLGQDTSLAGTQLIAKTARGIASRIVNINQTTRDLMDRQIRQSIKDGLSVTETARQLEEIVPEFNRSRVSTIARTELSNAWSKGTIASFKESETLTHASVIGCESAEPERWGDPSFQQFMWNGKGTCLAEDVPVDEMDNLNFHPNHTGCWVPSRFRNEDGSSADI
jgi:hypothetical protein